KTDFVATVSHELRTPLAAIYGAAMTVRREDITLETQLLDRLLQVIADESNRLAEIVNDLLLASNLDAGGLQVSIERCDGRELAAAVLEAERTRIFEKFYRLDPNMTRGIGGTGLGLYICRELVRRVDGRIWVEPNGGPGSTFVVEIPLAEQAPKRATSRGLSGAASRESA